MIKLFHNTKFVEDGFNSDIKLLNELTGELKELGTINSDDLEDAFMIAQNISEDCWVKHPDFTPTAVSIDARIRSFSMGDIVEKNGVYYIVATFGFRELK